MDIMPLPKIATPTYELVLPSSGETIRYRPFLVKEEKLLLVALQRIKIKADYYCCECVIKECVMTRGVKVDICQLLILNICS